LERKRRYFLLKSKETNSYQHSDIEVDLDRCYQIISKGGNWIDEMEAVEVLNLYGIRCIKTEVAETKNELKEITQRIGYPVVLKINSAEIVHKSDVGEVILDTKNKKELEESYETLINRVKAAFSRVELFKVIVQKSAPCGIEIIDDVVFRLAPITKSEARDMISELKAHKILIGARESHLQI